MESKRVSLYRWAHTASGIRAVAEKKPNARAPMTSPQARMPSRTLTNIAKRRLFSFVGFISTNWGMTPTAIPFITNTKRSAGGTNAIDVPIR